MQQVAEEVLRRSHTNAACGIVPVSGQRGQAGRHNDGYDEDKDVVRFYCYV